MFEGVESGIVKIKDRWYYYFGSIFLGNDMYRVVEFGHVIDSITLCMGCTPLVF